MWTVDFVNPLPNIVCFYHFCISIHTLIPQEFIDLLLYSRKGGTIWEYKSKENITHHKEIEFSGKNDSTTISWCVIRTAQSNPASWNDVLTTATGRVVPANTLIWGSEVDYHLLGRIPALVNYRSVLESTLSRDPQTHSSNPSSFIY